MIFEVFFCVLLLLLILIEFSPVPKNFPPGRLSISILYHVKKHVIFSKTAIDAEKFRVLR